MKVKRDYKGKIEQTVSWVNRLMRNKTIIALLLLIDGITFMISPKSGVIGLARGVAVTVGIAAVTVLIGAFSENSKTVKTWIAIGAAILALAAGIASYIWPEIPSAILIYILAFVVISNGISNILQTLRLEKIIKKRNEAIARLTSMEQEIKSKLPENEIANSLEQGVTEQFSRRLDPVTKITGRLSVQSVAAVLINILSIVMGVLILIFRNRAGNELMRLCGIAMVIAAATDLWISVRVFFMKRRQMKADNITKV